MGIVIRLTDSIGSANNDPLGDYIDPPPFVDLDVGESFSIVGHRLYTQGGLEVAKYEPGIGWTVTGYDYVTFHKIFARLQ
jgi:hypothetical protein